GLVAEIEARTADAYALAGTTFLAERHRARARELWEKTLATLPPELHVAFRAHPSRARTFGETKDARKSARESQEGESQEGARQESASAPIDVRRILEINRRLVSATTA